MSKRAFPTAWAAGKHASIEEGLFLLNFHSNKLTGSEGHEHNAFCH